MCTYHPHLLVKLQCTLLSFLRLYSLKFFKNKCLQCFNLLPEPSTQAILPDHQHKVAYLRQTLQLEAEQIPEDPKPLTDFATAKSKAFMASASKADTHPPPSWQKQEFPSPEYKWQMEDLEKLTTEDWMGTLLGLFLFPFMIFPFVDLLYLYLFTINTGRIL